MTGQRINNTIVRAVIDAVAKAVSSNDRRPPRSHQDKVVLAIVITLAALAYAFDNNRKHEWRDLAIKLGGAALLDAVLGRVFPMMSNSVTSRSASGTGILRALATAPFTSAGLASGVSGIAIGTLKGPILDQLAKECSVRPAARQGTRRKR